MILGREQDMLHKGAYGLRLGSQRGTVGRQRIRIVGPVALTLLDDSHALKIDW